MVGFKLLVQFFRRHVHNTVTAQYVINLAPANTKKLRQLPMRELSLLVQPYPYQFAGCMV